MQFRILAGICFIALLTACGGGGGGSGGGALDGSVPPTSSTGSSGTLATGFNTTTITAWGGPNSATSPLINGVTVTVTICVPGTSTCQSIPNVLVDTGSFGLRIFSSVLNNSLALGTGLTLTGPAAGFYYGECAQFADGNSWGGVALADISIGGETAPSTPIQVIGDYVVGNSTPPTQCGTPGASGTLEDTVASNDGLNGIIGVGLFSQDCNTSCASTTDPGEQNGGGLAAFYWSCPAGGGACTTTGIPNSAQVVNPVVNFVANATQGSGTADNNGVAVQFNSVPQQGAVSTTGVLIFGINTQTNNQLSGATIIAADLNTFFPALYSGQSLNGFFDSGSSVMTFPDASLAQCSNSSGFSFLFCPTNVPITNKTVAITTAAGGSLAAAFSIINLSIETGSDGYNVFSDTAGPAQAPLTGDFDFGMAFFYGRTLYFAVDNNQFDTYGSFTGSAVPTPFYGYAPFP